MAALPIYVVPHPVLRQTASLVSSISPDIQRLIDDMIETMYVAEGIGLAAPQIGVSQRILVLDVDQRGEDSKKNPRSFINPEIIWSSEEPNIYNEGCLSIPDQFAEIERPKKVRVKYVDLQGQSQEIEADGLLATCLQHEIDHLNGILFIDYLSKIKKDIILRKVKKWTKENADDIKLTHVL